MTLITDNGPVVHANEMLAGRVRQLDEHNQRLLGRLQTQADTINRLLDEKKQLEARLRQPSVVDKQPQLTIERHRATIDQQRERIHQQNAELRVARTEIAHSDELVRSQKQSLQNLREVIVELSGEVSGVRNENQRIRQLAEARLHHIHSLEEALENNKSLLATVNLEKLEAAVIDLDEVFQQIGDLLHAELTHRTRVS